MSEYIVRVDDLEESYYRYTDIQPETVFGHRIREEIVRCRDCKFCHKNYCEKRTSPTVSPSEIFWILVEPDGYCAWGIKRVTE